MSEVRNGNHGKLTQIIIENLEQMTFMEVEEATEPTEEKALSHPFVASLQVLSPFTDEFELLMPRDLVVEIAEELYNPDGVQITDQLIHDVIGEILNTLAGCIMAEIIGHDHQFKLGIPQTREAEIAFDITESYEYKFVMGDKFFLLRMPDQLANDN